MNDTRIIKQSASSKKTGRTNWDRIKKLTDDEIEQAARDDEDWDGLLDIDWSSADLVVLTRKKAVSIRLDEDVIDFFKAAGSGYQTRINQVLRSYMKHQSKKRKKA